MKMKTKRKYLKTLKLYRDYKGLIWLLLVCTILYGALFGGTLFIEDSNLFGDTAGATNGLFSALAFAGVVFAIFLQRNELQLQREELKQTRAELKGQKHEFEQQNETLKRQRFENTFFNMLSLQQEIINNISYVDEYKLIDLRMLAKGDKNQEIVRIGRDLFRYLYIDASILYKYNKRPVRVNGLKEVLAVNEVDTYSSITLIRNFDHYFRHLYRIVKFVNDSPLLPESYEDRYQYVSMVRAQLSRYELAWLFYNCLSENGKDKFKPLIEKYALLKNIRFDLLAKPEHRALYNNSAYEKTPPQES